MMMFEKESVVDAPSRWHWLWKGGAGTLAAWALVGCATLFSDGQDTITFNTNVPGVKVFLENSLIGETPLTVPVKRKLQERKLKFVKEGYETQEFPLAHEFNDSPGAMLDWVGTATTLTPGGVDALSGNLIRYSPTEYFVEMMPVKTGDVLKFKKRFSAKRYVGENYFEIQRDLARGEGEFLEALADSFEVRPEHRELFFDLLKAHRDHLLASGHGRLFWEQVNHLVGNNPALKMYRFG